MPGSVNGENVITTNVPPILTPRISTPKKNDEKTNPPLLEEAENLVSNFMLGSAKENNALLIFDFDQTITNESMCNFFVSKNYSDYNSGEENAVTEEKIKEFLQKKNSEIKNGERLKHILQSALSSEVEVTIASFAEYIKAVEYVVKNHLGLTEEQAQSIKVVGSTTKLQGLTADPLDSAEVAEGMTKYQNLQIKKHLCVLYLLKAYKKDKGMLPQKVMLVDGNHRNIDPADDFRENVKELLERDKDMKNILKNIDQEIAKVSVSEEELENITFKGINVSSEPITETNKAADDGYLGKVEKWIEELTQSLQDIKNPGTFPTPPPSYKADGSEKSLLGDNKKTNRFLQKVKYTMQKKKVTMPFVGLVMACCITAIVLGMQQREFIGFIGSVNPVTIFGGVLASCLILGVIWELMQVVRTKEHKITKRDTQEVLDKILGTLKEDEKCIKSLVLKYSNGNRVYFTFHSLPKEAKNNPNIVELTGQPIYYKSKVNSLINDRIWLPILGTVLITGNITFPLALYSTGGLNNIVSSYINPTIYWPIVAVSGTLLLFTLACAINHWSKTDFKDYLLLHKQDTNKDYLLLHKQDTNSENPNEIAITTVKNSQEKISSKLLQVVAERCGHPDITYIIN